MQIWNKANLKKFSNTRFLWRNLSWIMWGLEEWILAWNVSTLCIIKCWTLRDGWFGIWSKCYTWLKLSLGHEIKKGICAHFNFNSKIICNFCTCFNFPSFNQTAVRKKLVVLNTYTTMYAQQCKYSLCKSVSSRGLHCMDAIMCIIWTIGPTTLSSKNSLADFSLQHMAIKWWYINE